nr:hypothetical protein [Mycobacterium gordonae]
MTTSAPPPLTGGNASSDVVLGAVFSSAVIAALLTATFNLALARRKSLEEERARLRSTFAEAFEAVVRYKEMPYAILRRRKDEPGAERVRLAEEMREIQAKLSYYQVWIAGESAGVGAAYVNLVSELRRVAGKACHDAWKVPAASYDKDMNIGSDVVDLTEVSISEQAYIDSVKKHLDDFRKFHRLFGR